MHFALSSFFYFDSFPFFTNTMINGTLLTQDKNRRSRTAIISVNGAQRRLIEQKPNQFQKETEFWQNTFNEDFFMRKQADSFIEFWVWRSTKHEMQMDLFSFSSNEDAHLMNKVGNFSLWNWSESTTVRRNMSWNIAKMSKGTAVVCHFRTIKNPTQGTKSISS